MKSAVKPLIKPSRKGLLHEKLGVPVSKPIPRAKEVAAAKSPSPALRKEAQFALNFNKPAAPETARSHFGTNEISRAIETHAREQAKAK